MEILELKSTIAEIEKNQKAKKHWIGSTAEWK